MRPEIRKDAPTTRPLGKGRVFGLRVWRWLSPGQIGFLAISAGLNGVGHGTLALAAGLLGRELVQPVGVRPLGWSIGEVSYVGLAAAGVKAAGSILLAFSEARISGSVGLELRQRLVSRALSRGLPARAPQVLATLAVRLREVETALVQGAIAWSRAVAQLAPILAGMILVSAPLALGGTLLLLPFGAGLAALRRRLRAGVGRAQAHAEELHQGVDELVGHLDLWRCSGATDRVANSLAVLGARAASSSARVEVGRAALSASNEVLGALALVGAIVLAERAGFGLANGTLVAFAAMCFMAYRPLRDLGDARAWLSRGSVAFEALEPLLSAPEPERAAEPHAPGRLGPGELVFDEVGALERGPRTSFALAAGETVALVGPTGSGKTTLLRVLLGLEPSMGSIRYAGADLAAAPVGPEHRPFAWVPQDAPLVTGTVLENVALLSGDSERGRAALAELGATSLLERAGDVVGPGGVPLSGGERRLVAMARALATELPVLLLDEPAEGLDAESKRAVLRALERLKGKRAVLVVTHDEEVASAADRTVEIGAKPTRLAAE